MRPPGAAFAALEFRSLQQVKMTPRAERVPEIHDELAPMEMSAARFPWRSPSRADDLFDAAAEPANDSLQWGPQIYVD